MFSTNILNKREIVIILVLESVLVGFNQSEQKRSIFFAHTMHSIGPALRTEREVSMQQHLRYAKNCTELNPIPIV